MTTRFHIKGKGKVSQIYCLCCFNNQRVSFATGLYVSPDDWNDRKQKSGSAELNKRLVDIDSICASVYSSLSLSTPSFSKEMFKSRVKSVLSGDNGVVAPYYYRWATSATVKKHPNKQCLNSYNKFVEFAGTSVLFTDINDAFVERFTHWLMQRNYSLNYIGTQLKNLKAVMHRSYDEGMHHNDIYRRIRKMEEPADSIYLTKEEIARVCALDLPEGSVLQKARDLFIIGYYTAMRFSDYSRLSLSDIAGGYIKMATAKSQNVVVIPTHQLVIDTLERYGGHAPSITEQTFNRHIKFICMMAGITDDVIVTRTEGGRKVTRRVPKYTLVSSHTARRSGATNMYLSGIDTHSLMMITGHTTESAFLRYIRITKEENAARLAYNTFFRD